MKHHLNLLATPPSCLTKKKGWLMKTPVLPVQLGCFQQMCIYRRDQQCTELLQWQTSKKKNEVISGTTGWSQPTNQKDFGLKGFGKNREKTSQTSKEKYRMKGKTLFLGSSGDPEPSAQKTSKFSSVNTRVVVFVWKKGHQAILIHRSKPNWIHQSNFRVCFLKKPSLPNHHWPWDPTWAPYTSTTFWQKKASI